MLLLHTLNSAPIFRRNRQFDGNLIVNLLKVILWRYYLG